MWTRTRRGTLRYNDGEFVHILALPLASLTNALTPETTGEIVVSNINWNQMNYDAGTAIEMAELQSLDSIAIRNLHLECEMYIRGNTAVTDLEPALLYTPTIFFANVMDLRDTTDDQGYPASVTTDSFPNYFGRNYGSLDPSLPQASPNDVYRAPFHGANRTVLRRFALMDAGLLNGQGYDGSDFWAFGTNWRKRFTCTVRKPIRLGPKQGLVLGVQAYNTVDNDQMVLVCAIHGRFGYHRFKRDMHA